jgi:putative nucleotidyltransferase with HDIG domain
VEPSPLVSEALGLLRELIPYEGDRLLHVEAVACATQELGRILNDATSLDTLVAAAWLHDIGYAPALRDTGHHAIDGAAYLQRRGWPDSVTSLVAHHSGAAEEALQRGLSARLADFAPPVAGLADVLTLSDMTCGPAGQVMSIDARLRDILGRYPSHHPVHRAVTASASQLRASAARAERRLLVAAQPR